MKHILFYLLIIIVTSSCTQELVPYTSKIQRETGLNQDQLKKVQFYNSGKIVLYREVGKNTTEVVSGEIKIIDGKEVEQIVINPTTPGVIVDAANGKRFGISFEEGPDRYMVFGENPKRNGMYYIFARDWKGDIAKVDYDGKEYKLAPESTDAILLVNLKKLRAMKIKSRTAVGRKVK